MKVYGKKSICLNTLNIEDMLSYQFVLLAAIPAEESSSFAFDGDIMG